MSKKSFVLRGKVVLVNGADVYRWLKGNLEVSRDNGETWRLFHKLRVPLWQRLLMSIHLLSRLLRFGVHHLIPCDTGLYILVNRQLYKVDKAGKVQGCIVRYHGSRPLCVAVNENRFFYGKYFSNPTREPVKMYSFDGERHEEVFEVSNVRHIHGVFSTVESDVLWVTTGDYGCEAGIWSYKDHSLTPVLVGGQKARAVGLVFKGNKLLYGTDTPLEKNYLRELCLQSGEVIDLQEVGSSVFYGCKLKGIIFFATVIEPSEVNKTDRAELWYSCEGQGWRLLESRKKDLWPMKLFQYGQFLFPTIATEPEFIWYYVQGLKGSGKSYRTPLPSLPVKRNIQTLSGV